jgi:hypothetical protein
MMKSHWARWVIGIVIAVSGGWGLAVLYFDFLNAAKNARYELASFGPFANLIVGLFLLSLFASLLFMIHQRSSPKVSPSSHIIYSLTFGMALGFFMAAHLVAKTPLADTVWVLSTPAILLSLGLFRLGLAPHGDVGWNLLFWTPILQWFLIGVAAYHIGRKIREKKAKQAIGADSSARRV